MVSNTLPFPYRIPPITNITPFTYRDGVTYLETLERIRSAIRDGVIPEMDANLKGLMAEFQRGIENAEGTITNSVEEFNNSFSTFMADVEAELGVLSESAVATIIRDPESPARSAIDAAVSLLASTQSTVLKTLLDNSYTMRGEYFANVQDFGALGDGVVDDTAAIQRAIDSIKANKGGTLFFPPGRYMMDTAAYLCDNITITGNGATLEKRRTSAHYAMFIGSSGTQKGYGAGPSNITCSGITFKGNYRAGQKRFACAFTLHHSQNVNVYDCIFTEMAGGGHRFDLTGCRNINIHNNIFEGFDTSYGSGFYNEDIQLDYSVNGSPSHTEESNLCFDGLATRDIFVSDNIWRPITVDGITYPAANPLGTHSSNELNYHENIYFTNNIVGGNGGIVEDLDAENAGALHFVCPRNLNIIGNTFHNDGKITNAIHINNGIGGIPWNEVGNPNAVWQRFTVPQAADKVVIRDNTFIGFTHTRTDRERDTIQIKGHITGPTYAKNISIENNVFRGSKGTVDTGPTNITLLYCESAKVSNNTSDGGRRFTYIAQSNRISVDANTVKNVYGYTVSVNATNLINVTNNVLSGSIHGWEIYFTYCIGGTVSGNTIEATTTAKVGAPTIRLTNSTHFTVIGNFLQALLNMVPDMIGIEAMNNSTKIMVANNVVQGFTTGVSARNSSVIVDVNNLTT